MLRQLRLLAEHKVDNANAGVHGVLTRTSQLLRSRMLPKLPAAAAHGEIRLRRRERVDDGSAELAEAAARSEVLLIPSAAGHFRFRPSKEALKQQQLLARVFDWKDERLLEDAAAVAAAEDKALA